MRLRDLLTTGMLIGFLVGPAAAKVGTWSTTQVTDNEYPSSHPQVDDGKIVWEGAPASSTEIFFWNGATTTQLTNNTTYDQRPKILDGNVAWGGDSGVFFWDGVTTTQLWSGPGGYVDMSGPNVVWHALDPTGTDYEVFFWDGSSVSQVTDNDVHDLKALVSGTNVVWESGEGNALDLFFWDGQTTTQLDTDKHPADYYDISGTNVVWENGGILLWDGVTTTQLSATGTDPRISGDNVVWDDGGVVFWDGTTTTQVSTSGEYPHISGTNVVWVDDQYPGDDLFVWDGETTTQLADDAGLILTAQVSGNQVVWSEGVQAHEWEIFFAEFVEGDLDADGDVDADDIDIYCEHMGDADYDLDGDGDADEDDLTVFVATLVELQDGSGRLGTAMGDFNLDGLVNATDVAVVKANFGIWPRGWAQGNANCDDIVDGTDLAILADNLGYSAPAGAIPEPAAMGLLAAGALGALKRRRT